jgi:hypothetical protein
MYEATIITNDENKGKTHLPELRLVAPRQRHGVLIAGLVVMMYVYTVRSVDQNGALHRTPPAVTYLACARAMILSSTSVTPIMKKTARPQWSTSTRRITSWLT